jgi:hypothetical protein
MPIVRTDTKGQHHLLGLVLHLARGLAIPDELNKADAGAKATS